MPSWNDIMNRVLPLSGNRTHRIGSPYGEVRPVGSSPHGGIDFNYSGGQTGINLTNPPLYAPVSGTIVGRVGGPDGTISIRDNNGYIHQILHTQDRYVRTNDEVAAGQPIGTMGATGAKGGQHVHYQLKAPQGRAVNPEEYWSGTLGVSPPDSNGVGTIPLPRPRPDIPEPSTIPSFENPYAPSSAARDNNWLAPLLSPKPLTLDVSGPFSTDGFSNTPFFSERPGSAALSGRRVFPTETQRHCQRSFLFRRKSFVGQSRSPRGSAAPDTSRDSGVATAARVRAVTACT
jgi:hypothetical protein